MSFLTALGHPLRTKRLYNAFQAFSQNWKNPDTKYLQREYLIPVVNAALIAACKLFNYDLSTMEKSTIAAMTITAVVGILLRKLSTGEFQVGWAKLQEREFTMPILTEIIILANKVFSLGLDEKTILYLAATAAGGVVTLVTKKAIEAKQNATLPKQAALSPGGRSRPRA